MAHRRHRWTPPETTEEKMFEALCYHYWGAQDYARQQLLKITEEVIAGNVKTFTETKTKEVQNDGNDDYDYADAAPGDYPWEGWRYS